jgi:hypothetical protein
MGFRRGRGKYVQESALSSQPAPSWMQPSKITSCPFKSVYVSYFSHSNSFHVLYSVILHCCRKGPLKTIKF